MPLLTPLQSAACSSLLTLSYVGGLYISASTRVGSLVPASSADVGADDTPASAAADAAPRRRGKNDEDVVYARLRTVGIVSVAGVGATIAVLWQAGAARESRPFFRLLSLLSALGMPLPTPSLLTSSAPFEPSLSSYLLSGLRSIGYALGLTATLYTGPLLVSGLDEELPGQKEFEYKRDVRGKWDNVWGLRNYVVGPLTEEVIFRGCILALTAAAGAKGGVMIFATPLYFAIAHVHHAYETYLDSGKTREGLVRGVTHASIQFAYTCIFGWYANFLHLRTGNLLAPLTAHVFCNIMGLPNPAGASKRHMQRKGAIYAAHLVGIVGFAWGIAAL
ncbi:Abi-domain-containing protein [Tilletiopsis washingtonensis]|uniref:intramembrane prenyl-peptidase Rce1 n=1 Tax=Tilletiopsis washingtonensis TaxID=58919 RepID=A0A316ZBT5_9BASI|nr:Abi-domain-containing protein [Tilletiopsis washingtonensis]PWN97673.1 Abi-domain-containing protein [Tilletiopsis washingtonensis]